MCGRPMACSSSEEHRNTRVRGKEVALKHQERLPDHLKHKGQGTGITPPLNTHSHSFLLSGSWHSMLGTSPGGSLPFRETPTTPALSITSKDTPVEDTVYKSQADVKPGLSLCTAAWAFTYRAHASRNPVWSLMPLDP